MPSIDPIKIIEKHYAPGTKAHDLLVAHSEAVAAFALECASCVANANPDLEFVYQGAMLHDIGMLHTDAPMLGCTGRNPYITHGVFGAAMLVGEGLPRLARVCESHVGVGISIEDIIENRFPLPQRDMLPSSIEEIIISYADKFFSKNVSDPRRRKSLDEAARSIERYGARKLEVFLTWARMFGHTN